MKYEVKFTTQFKKTSSEQRNSIRIWINYLKQFPFLPMEKRNYITPEQGMHKKPHIQSGCMSHSKRGSDTSDPLRCSPKTSTTIPMGLCMSTDEPAPLVPSPYAPKNRTEKDRPGVSIRNCHASSLSFASLCYSLGFRLPSSATPQSDSSIRKES